MKKRVLFIASNYGLWAEELQAPWDTLKTAGFDLTLATKFGKVPLPLKISMDPELVDPIQNYLVNPREVVDRVKEILKNGDWDNPLTIEEARMSDYNALVIVGGPGAPLDITGNPFVHRLILEAYKSNKIIGAVCYAVGALVFTRDPDNSNKSIIYGKKVTAHPHAWDFETDLGYDLIDTTKDNHGTNLITQGFVYPLQYITEDAVGPEGEVLADVNATRENPCVAYDKPFVSALSVESSITFGEKLRDVLSG